MKLLKWGLGVLLVIILLAAGFTYGYLKSTLPDYDGELVAPGLKGEVEIIRESYGMPHIYAETDEDAYFALGYSMAQDRLFQMDMVRRAIEGRLSEIMGDSLVPVDTFFRTITAMKSVEEITAENPSEVISAIEAFTAGVNFFLEERDGPLPIEFLLLGYEPEPWAPKYSVGVIYYMSWKLNSTFSVEMLFASVREKIGDELARKIFIDYPTDYPTINDGSTGSIDLGGFGFLRSEHLARDFLGASGGGASNNWVISGAKSETGMPILANDPHLGHGAPLIWYEAHLKTPTMNISGATIPGVPFITTGANEHTAWGMTNSYVDDSDFYLEKINPDNPDQYEYQGRWVEMEVKEEVIKVKDSEDVTISIRLTRHGPIIDEVNKYDEPEGYAISMRWTASEFTGAANALYLFNMAKDIDDLEEAMEYWKCPGQNWVYADDHGNIGYWAAMGIPIREGFDGALPIPGWDGKHEWSGFVNTEEEPHLRNPSMGWIATANNKQVDDDYPYTIAYYWAVPDRYVRIAEMLTEKEKFTVSDFVQMQADVYMVLGEEWVPVIEDVLSGRELSETESDALATLTEWDYMANVDGVAPTIFHSFMQAMVENTFKKRLGDDLFELYVKNRYMPFNVIRQLMSEGESLWFDDPETPETETLDELVANSFSDAVFYLEKEMGAGVDDWIWGELHTLTIYHPFGKKSKLFGFFMNSGPFPMGGSLFTVSPAHYHLEKPWDVYAGGTLRYIIDLSEEGNSKRIIAGGTSGNFMSPHYNDQVEPWLKGEYRPFVLDREEVEKDIKYKTVLKPE